MEDDYDLNDYAVPSDHPLWRWFEVSRETERVCRMKITGEEDQEHAKRSLMWITREHDEASHLKIRIRTTAEAVEFVVVDTDEFVPDWDKK